MCNAMGMWRLRSALFSLVTLTAIAIPSIARADRPDFSGVWQLDPQASKFSSQPVPTSGTISVHQDGKKVRISESYVYPRGEKSKAYEWRTDNRYHPVDAPEGAGMGQVIARWDGDSLAGDRKTGTGSESIRFMLSDANTLTQTVQDSSGFNSTVVWRRR